MTGPANQPAGRQGEHRLRRSAKLLEAKDFQRVARRGVRVSSTSFVMLVAPSRAADSRLGGVSLGPRRRIGITTSRKVGPAVVRNRVRRGVREWFRHHRGAFLGDVDVVIIARPAAARLGTNQIAAELTALSAQSEVADRRRGRA